MKILIAGDFCDNDRVSEPIKNKDYSRMFDEVRPIIVQSDLSIVNFEFPIALPNAKPIDKTGKNLKGHINAVEALKYAGFSAVTIANNHIKDWGEDSFMFTINKLNQSGIRTIGGGNNIKDASKVEYFDIGAERLAVINCCESEFSISSDKEAGSYPLDPIKQWYQIKEAKEYANYCIVIVHGGIEHHRYPTVRMKETYRFFIDAGANAVINHHQHCFCGYEEYSGGVIFYGLGNFLFDMNGHRNSSWNKGYMVCLTLKQSKIAYTLIPYEQCNDSVSVTLIDDKCGFGKEIEALNKIIQKDSLLDEKLIEFVFKTSSEFKYALSPYFGRFLQALYVRGWLPNFWDKKRWLILQNLIRCESHRERLLEYINQFIHKKWIHQQK